MKSNYFILFILLLFVATPLLAQDSHNVDLVDNYFHSTDNPDKICSTENFAFICTGQSGLVILDISEAGNDEVISTWESNYHVFDCAVYGNYLYVANGYAGVSILDISDILNPELVNSITFSETVTAVAVDANRLITSAYNIAVYDISDPENPVEISSIEYLGSEATELAISGNNILYADYGVLDLRDGIVFWLELDENNELTIVEEFEFGVMTDILFYDHYVFITSEYHSVVLDLLTRNYTANTFENAHGLALRDSTLIAVSQDHGISFYNISDPLNPDLISSTDLNVDFRQLIINNSNAYIICGFEGLKVLDIEDYTNPQFIDTILDEKPLLHVEVEDGYAYLSDENKNLMVFDINDSGGIEKIASLEFNTNLVDYEIRDTLLFASCAYGSQTCFKCINISDPANPVEIDSYQIPNYNLRGSGISLSGNFAYVCSYRGISVIEITNPDSPELISQFATDDSCDEIIIQGEYAYIIDGDLLILDVSNLHNISIASQLELPGRQFNLDINGNYVYTVSSWNDLNIIDVSDPFNPTLVGNADIEDEGYDVEVMNGYAYVAAEDEGLRVIDVSDPENPFEAGYYNSPGIAGKLALSDNYVFLADKYYLEVFDCSNALAVEKNFNDSMVEDFRVLPAYPNPFNSSINIPFSLPAKSQVAFSVYNVLGQKVYSSSESYTAGRHIFYLNMKQTDPLNASGNYIITAKSKNTFFSQKVLYLK